MFILGIFYFISGLMENFGYIYEYKRGINSVLLFLGVVKFCFKMVEMDYIFK